MGRVIQNEAWIAKYGEFNPVFDYVNTSVAEFQGRIVAIYEYFVPNHDRATHSGFMPKQVLIQMLGLEMKNWRREIVAAKVKGSREKLRSIDLALGVDQEHIAAMISGSEPKHAAFLQYIFGLHYGGAYAKQDQDSEDDGAPERKTVLKVGEWLVNAAKED